MKHGNDESSTNHEDIILLDPNDSPVNQEQQVLAVLAAKPEVDAVICVAGGWCGGSASSSNFIPGALSMLSQSLHSSLLAARVASVKKAPLLVLTGAAAALQATPAMIGYGVAKSAVHALTKSLAAKGSGLVEGGVVVALLPVMLDTQANRKSMPNADWSSTWTPLPDVAQLIYSFIQTPPTSGSLIRIETKNGVTETTVV